MRFSVANSIKAMNDFLKNFPRPIPKYIKINEKYLLTLIENGTVTKFEKSPNGDYVNVPGWESLPIVVDNTVATYEFIF